MLVERSALYGSRSLFDQHRDMRLDIDDMSYEVANTLHILFSFIVTICMSILKYRHKQELLALGERIGSVSTGLSEDLIPKCLTESIYCSSDQIQEEGSCAICLVSIPFGCKYCRKMYRIDHRFLN